MFTSAKKQNQFTALNERGGGGGGGGKRLATEKQRNHLPGRQPHHEYGLPDSQVYLHWAVLNVKPQVHAKSSVPL